jgi:hypothetical protein
MRLFNGAGASHLLRHMEHVPVAFQIKNRKDNVKILKRSHGPLNYTPYSCKFYCHNPL